MTPEHLEKIRHHLIWTEPDDLEHKVTLRHAHDLLEEVKRLRSGGRNAH